MRPLVINLTGKKVLIVGGGSIAYRKAKVLSEDGPRITFIAHEFHDEVIQLCKKHQYHLEQRMVRDSDFQECILIILATNDREFNQQIARRLPVDQLICVVDEHEDGNVLFPANIRRGDLHISVSTTGGSPKLTKKIKRILEMQFDETWTDYTQFLSRARRIIQSSSLSKEDQHTLLEHLIDDDFRRNLSFRNKIMDEIQFLTKQSSDRKDLSM